VTQDVTNPGSVNVANQAFGRGLGAGQSQSVTVLQSGKNRPHRPPPTGSS